MAAVSTIAYSIVNVLAVHLGGASKVELVRASLQANWPGPLPEADFAEALRQLERRKLVTVTPPDFVALVHNRALVGRDRSGDGWNGWMQETHPGSLRNTVHGMRGEPVAMPPEESTT
jgi:hypothetical protein